MAPTGFSVVNLRDTPYGHGSEEIVRWSSYRSLMQIAGT